MFWVYLYTKRTEYIIFTELLTKITYLGSKDSSKNKVKGI